MLCSATADLTVCASCVSIVLFSSNLNRLTALSNTNLATIMLDAVAV